MTFARRVLVAGWFSFGDGHATAGDLLAGDLARRWVEQAGHSCDVAVAPSFREGIDWRSADPQQYSDVVFVCGPFGNGPLESEFLQRFATCRVIGLNLSMMCPLQNWNPFHLLLERDSSRTVRPDIVFLTDQPHVPVVGVVLVEDYEGAWVRTANRAIGRLLDAREAAVVQIDTRLDRNATGLRNPAEIESLIARMDIVVTTRLHGVVLALKNGVPPVAIDPIPGGDKIRRQMELLGWPAVFTVDSLSDQALAGAFDYCLTEAGRARARACGQEANALAAQIRRTFLSWLTESHPSPNSAPPLVTAQDNGSRSNVPTGSRLGVWLTPCWEEQLAQKDNWEPGSVRATGLGRLLVRRSVPAPLRHWLREQWRR
jgi:hypothetical protein